MDSGATDFQIEAAISKIFASVRFGIKQVHVRPLELSDDEGVCPFYACVCSGSSVDGD